MYTSFFGLNEKPFTITPDPRYLFMSERHGEGLAHLVYGVTESGGFIQLTGEVGTGKTTLVRTLLGQIPAEVDIALILNPELTAVEFLTAICEELGTTLPKNKYSKKALVDTLNRHLLEAHAHGRRIILLIDEAQNLSEGVLEQLRLLTNLETARQKLLQIILIAQPELREKLAQKSLRQLAQRVTGRYHLEPLSREEAFQYIDHRLRVAGALTEIFDAAAKREVFRLSGGVPRVMNVICDRALLGAYSRVSRVVNKRLVRKAASEVSGQRLSSELLKWLVPVLGIAILILAGLLLWKTIGNNALPPAETGAAKPASSGVVALASAAAQSSAVAAISSPLAVLPPPPGLEAQLATYVDTNSVDPLLSHWGARFNPEGDDGCDQPAAQSLSGSCQRGTWTTLRQLDRPVRLTLTKKNGDTRSAALMGLDSANAELSMNSELPTIPFSVLDEFLFGQFVLIWNPANANSRPIRPGMESADVRWPGQSLATLDDSYQPGDVASAVFEAELQSMLIAFQHRQRLDADGGAGEQTKGIFNSLLTQDSSPRPSRSL